MNRRGTRLAVIAGAVVLLVIVAVRFVHRPVRTTGLHGKISASQVVGVMPLHRGDISEVITLTADIQPINQAAIYSQVSGYLDEINVRRGYHVKKGQVLAHINDTTLLAQFHQAEANRDYVCLNARRYKTLLAKNLVSKDAYDLADSQCRQAQASVDYSKKMLSYANIVAPFNGYIFNRMVDPGATIPATTAALSANSNPLFTVVDTHIVKIVVNIPERDIRYIQVGLPINVMVDAYPGEVFPGKVTRMNPSLDTQTRTLAIEIDMPNPKEILKPGMFAKVTLHLDTHRDVPLVPKRAFITRQKKTYLYVVDSGIARKRLVTIGIIGRRHAEITSGLSPGDQVVVAGQEHLEDGDHVQTTLLNGPDSK
ncbi:MAG: efflux RND transporter periplasmic adaptor subunit [Nitrospirota bacterium]|nr:efflux RND transporter periplasmic adaptor subunit [Nitrospirota bacterium]